MSLEQNVMELLEELPDDHLYRITYDQGARMGRWRIIAIDKKTFKDVFGGAGSSIVEARDQLQAVRDSSLRWNEQSANDASESV